MNHGLLNKLVLCVVSIVAFSTILLTIYFENKLTLIENRLNGIEGGLDKKIIYGKYAGIESAAFDEIIGNSTEVHEVAYVHNIVEAHGVNAYLPDVFDGLTLKKISILIGDGKLYLWFLDGGDEVVWDVYVPNGVVF